MTALRPKENIWNILKLLILAIILLLHIPLGIFLVLAVCLLDILHHGIAWRDLGLAALERIYFTVVVSLIIAAAYQLISINGIIPLTARIAGTPIDLQDVTALRGNPLNFLIAFLVSWTIAAFGEEIVYRGYLYHLVRKILPGGIPGMLAGILFCSLLFSIGHEYQGIVGMVENFLFGLLLAAVYAIRKNNLWFPIFIHGFVDTIGFCLILFGLYP